MRAALSQRAPRVVARLMGAALLAASGAALWLWPVGPPLLEITTPTPEMIVGPEALEVMVRFPPGGGIRHETFRARLNGADVTDSFETADNGAWGRLVRVVDGDNVLEVAVFGRGWWPEDRLVEHRRLLHFRVRRAVDRYWG